MRRQRRLAFSLIELVVVILILGIIAAVATPRLFSTVDNAEKQTTRQQLALVRNALQIYRSQNTAYPTGATLATDLAPLINGTFPQVGFGPNKGDAGVSVDATNSDAAITAATGTDTNGWRYKPQTGEFKLNLNASAPEWNW